MKKTLLFSFFLAALIFSINFTSFNDDNSTNVLSTYDGPSWNGQSDTGITCSPAAPPEGIRDDGTYENGYRSVATGDSTTMVHKMRIPSGGAFTMTAICVAWTSSPSTSIPSYQLVIYDTTGAGGAPGNVPVAVVSGVSATGIAAFPGFTRYRYPVNITGLTPGGAYYIGVRWNNNPIISAFFSSDENGTNLGPGYQRNTTTFPPTWAALTVGFPNWKNLAVRYEGTTAPPGGGQQISLCRTGISIFLPDHSTVRDSVQFVSSSACTVSDVNVRINSLTHTWDADVSMYMQKGTVGVKIVNQVGGSGDNFINTVLDDSAATPIASGTAPFTGNFRPSNPLAPFNGQQAAGYWRLVLTDTATGDTGQLTSWCVVVSYQNCVGINTTVEIPNHYILSQNYPNPFNPSTTIKFGMPKGENVQLVIYDMLGREVRTLVNEFRASGIHEVNFDASALASGVYFYKLVTPNFTETKRMLLVK